MFDTNKHGGALELPIPFKTKVINFFAKLLSIATPQKNDKAIVITKAFNIHTFIVNDVMNKLAIFLQDNYKDLTNTRTVLEKAHSEAVEAFLGFDCDAFIEHKATVEIDKPFYPIVVIKPNSSSDDFSVKLEVEISSNGIKRVPFTVDFKWSNFYLDFDYNDSDGTIVVPNKSKQTTKGDNEILLWECDVTPRVKDRFVAYLKLSSGKKEDVAKLNNDDRFCFSKKTEQPKLDVEVELKGLRFLLANVWWLAFTALVIIVTFVASVKSIFFS
jgi:hypothetical protein